jgi:hypothetical protein
VREKEKGKREKGKGERLDLSTFSPSHAPLSPFFQGAIGSSRQLD